MLSFDACRAVAQRRRIDPGAALAAWIDMLQFDAVNLIGNLLFSSIGFVAFIYGKRMHFWKVMLCGLLLMIFPYFVENMSMLYAIGGAATIALFFLRD